MSVSLNSALKIIRLEAKKLSLALSVIVLLSDTPRLLEDLGKG